MSTFVNLLFPFLSLLSFPSFISTLQPAPHALLPIILLSFHISSSFINLSSNKAAVGAHRLSTLASSPRGNASFHADPELRHRSTPGLSNTSVSITAFLHTGRPWHPSAASATPDHHRTHCEGTSRHLPIPCIPHELLVSFAPPSRSLRQLYQFHRVYLPFIGARTVFCSSPWARMVRFLTRHYAGDAFFTALNQGTIQLSGVTSLLHHLSQPFLTWPCILTSHLVSNPVHKNNKSPYL